MGESTINIYTKFVEYVHERTWRIDSPKHIKNIENVESPVFHFKQYVGKPPVGGYVKLICSCLNNQKQRISTHEQFSHESMKLPITVDIFKYDCVFLKHTVKFIISESIIDENKNVIAREIETQAMRMKRHISALYLNPEYSDITFYVGDSVFPAHKFILAGRSPVFRKMFLSDMKEQMENKVYISHFTAEAFNCMLYYMYTEKLQDLETMIDELIFIAHMYDIEALMNECQRFLTLNMNTENVLDTLIIADKLGLKDLQKVCLDYIALQRKSICSKKEFEDIKEHHQDIALQILDGILDMPSK